MKKHIQPIAWIASVSFLVLILAGTILTGRSNAQTKKFSPRDNKLSAELEKRARAHNADEDRVKIVLQLNKKPSGQFGALLGRHGIHKANHFDKLNIQVLEVPASILKEMADFDEVSFISLDKEVEMHGHVETTTGAAVARQQTTSGSGSVSDGRGATIAVLDSGMFKDQESFKDKRVAFQMDFTGEGKTNDFYGHGTPTANIISLKVLNAQGRGTVSGLLNALNWILTNRATYNIRVVNMNLSTAASDSYKNDPLSLAVRKLVDAGIVVIDAAGDNGRNSNGNEAKP